MRSILDIKNKILCRDFLPSALTVTKDDHPDWVTFIDERCFNSFYIAASNSFKRTGSQIFIMQKEGDEDIGAPRSTNHSSSCFDTDSYDKTRTIYGDSSDAHFDYDNETLRTPSKLFNGFHVTFSEPITHVGTHYYSTPASEALLSQFNQDNQRHASRSDIVRLGTPVALSPGQIGIHLYQHQNMQGLHNIGALHSAPYAPKVFVRRQSHIGTLIPRAEI